MKRFLSLLLGTALIFSLCIPALAADNSIKVTVDDRDVVFTDAQPFCDENNRTLIPVRFVSEAMNADVTWDNNARVATVVKDGTQVDITIGSKTLKVTKAGKTSYVTMDTVAVIKNERTYLPIRFVVEALGGYVDWASVYNTVEIVSADGNVSAAEIKRLRSYSPVQYWGEKNNPSGRIVSSELDAIYKTNYSKDYWFANAHSYLMNCCPESKQDVRSLMDQTVVQKGANERTYVAAAINFIEQAVVRKADKPAGGIADDGAGAIGSSYNGLYQLKFRTCEALTYHEDAPKMEVVAVRGVLDVTVNNNENAKKALQYMTTDFGIQNPELGKTYTVDAEFVVGVDRWGYFTTLGKYTLTNNGPIKWA